MTCHMNSWVCFQNVHIYAVLHHDSVSHTITSGKPHRDGLNPRNHGGL